MNSDNKIVYRNRVFTKVAKIIIVIICCHIFYPFIMKKIYFECNIFKFQDVKYYYLMYYYEYRIYY